MIKFSSEMRNQLKTMKILILTCNTGGGHNAAAGAVAEECERRSLSYELIDALDAFAGERISAAVCKTYTGIVKNAPQVFNAAYHAGDLISSNRHKSPVYAVAKQMRHSMFLYIERNGFDVVITTHLFVAQALTALKLQGSLKRVMTVAIATDYTCIPFWEETSCDYYVAPHKELLDEYAAHGMPVDRILPVGIPVSTAFLTHTDKRTARQTLGLPVQGRIILIMTGSMGYGHIEQLVDTLLLKAQRSDGAIDQNGGGAEVSVSQMPEYHIAVVCGSNEKVQNDLKSKFAGDDRLHIFGFEKRIALFMDACDVLLTKPGGLTTTEAAVHAVPLIHTNPIPGCETKNAQFFAAHGMSVIANDVETQAAEALRLCLDRTAAETLIHAQKSQINPHAAKDLMDFVTQRMEGCV